MILEGERKRRLELAAHRAWEERFVRLKMRQVGFTLRSMLLDGVRYEPEAGDVTRTLERALGVKLP